MNDDLEFRRAAARQRNRQRKALLIILVPMSALSGVVAGTFCVAALVTHAAWEVLIGFSFAIACVLLIRVAVRETRRVRPVRIVPYFESPIGSNASYFKGRALAANLVSLDALAERAGVDPLSSFGFADDHASEIVRWRSADDLLRTIAAVIEESGRSNDVTSYRRTDPDEDVDAVRSDLRVLHDDVQIAAARDVRVALLVLPGDVAGPTGGAGRRGYFR